jgi:hypothetical protein
MNQGDVNVPKVAAMLASLVLIAGSIGVNIARYPAVGQLAQSGELLPGGPVQSMPAPAMTSQATASQATQRAVLHDPISRALPQASGAASRKERAAVGAQPPEGAEPTSRSAVAQRLPDTAVAATAPQPAQTVANQAYKTPGTPGSEAVATMPATPSPVTPLPITIVAIRPLVNVEANPFVSPQTNATLVSDTTASARSESVVARLPGLDRVAPLDPSAVVEVNQPVNYPSTNTP